jgi:hypothetical protein
MVWSTGLAYAQADAAVATDGGIAVSVANKLDRPVVAANLENLKRQAELINQLADKFESDAAAQFGAGFNAIDWRRDFSQRLVYQPMESLSAALDAPDLSRAQNQLFTTSRKVGAKHSTDSSWTINLLTSPCRIVDTRSGGGGQLGPTYRLWFASAANPSIIAGQGGNPAGCGNFPNADGFLLYVTVVPPSSGGANFLTVQHDNFPTPPTSATMNYYNQNLANFAITACNGCASFDGGFYAYASGNTHVVVDMVGWTGTLGQVALDCVATSLASQSVAAGGTFSLNAPACPAGYTRVSVSCRSSSFSATTFASMGPDHQASGECQGMNTSGAAVTEFAAARCCRVPGL